MRVRYVGPIEELTVVPAGQASFNAARLEWVDVDPAVAGKRPSANNPGEGLLAQGDWVDGKFEPLWETEAAKKGATRAAAEKE